MRQKTPATFLFIFGALLFASAIVGHAADKAPKTWAYSGKTGPDKWDKLEKDFEQCKLGQFQSPIDIPDASTRKGDLPSLLFVYKPSPLRIIDDGHAIQVNYSFAGSLTTPPCSEDVTCFVLKTPMQLSADQLARFDRLYPMNARPVQPLNGRDIEATR